MEDNHHDSAKTRSEAMRRLLRKFDRRIKGIEEKNVKYDIYWGIVIFLAGTLIAGIVAVLLQS